MRKLKMIALFPGKFQPLHLGHIVTIRRLQKTYEKVIVLVTKDGSYMSQEEIVNTLKEVLPEVEVATISGRLVDRTRFSLKRQLRNLHFDIIVSGNNDVIDWALKVDIPSCYYPRSTGPLFSGTELRKC